MRRISHPLKLTLKTETLKLLVPHDLKQVGGGSDKISEESVCCPESKHTSR